MNGEEKRNEWEVGPYRCIITICLSLAVSTLYRVNLHHNEREKWKLVWLGRGCALPTRHALMTTTMGSLSHASTPFLPLWCGGGGCRLFISSATLLWALIYIYNQICQHAVITQHALSATRACERAPTKSHLYANALYANFHCERCWTNSFPWFPTL